MALDDTTITLRIGAGAAERAIACRRPTRGELDLPRLAILVGLFQKYRATIDELEQGPVEGAAEKVAEQVALANDAARALQKRVIACVEKIAPEGDRADARAWLSEETDAAWAERVIRTYLELSTALLPPGMPGK